MTSQIRMGKQVTGTIVLYVNVCPLTRVSAHQASALQIYDDGTRIQLKELSGTREDDLRRTLLVTLSIPS